MSYEAWGEPDEPPELPEGWWDEDQVTEAKDRIADLEKQNKILELKANASLANNLCPDHRDKQTGKPCLACKIDAMEKQLAENDKEIERMRAVINSCKKRKGSLPFEVWDRLTEYEQSTKPDGGTET